MRRVLAHARDEARRARVGALVFVGDAMEERVDPLLATAAELALVGVKAFMFQEGDDPAARRAFKEIARLTGGAYEAFNAGAAARLEALLQGGGRLRGGRPDGAGGAGGPRRLRPRPAGTDARSVTRDAARRRVGNRFLPCRHSSPEFSPSICLLLGIRRFARLSPASAAAMVRNGGAVAVFVVAGFLLLRGNFAGAATLAAVATSLGLFGRGGRLASVFRRRRPRGAAAAGSRRRVRRRSRCGSTRTPGR